MGEGTVHSRYNVANYQTIVRDEFHNSTIRSTSTRAQFVNVTLLKYCVIHVICEYVCTYIKSYTYLYRSEIQSFIPRYLLERER